MPEKSKQDRALTRYAHLQTQRGDHISCPQMHVGGGSRLLAQSAPQAGGHAKEDKHTT